MAEQGKNSNTSLSRYLNYFKDILSGKERHSLEKQMMRDKFEEEAFEGMSSIDPSELESDILGIHDEINKRMHKKKGRNMTFLKYAASIAILLAVGSLVILVRKSEVEKQTLAEQTEMIDSSVTIPVTLAEIEDTVRPEIAQTTKIKKEEKAIAKTKIAKEEPAMKRSKPMDQLERKDKSVEYTTEIPEEDIYEKEGEKKYGAGMSSGKAEGVGQIPKSRPQEMRTVPAVSDVAYRQDLADNTITIKGRVMDASYEEPLPGVNVAVKGTEHATITDLQGKFSIDVPADQHNTLEFASLGYVEEQIEVEDDKNIDISLTEDIVALDEVVVVGYGVQKKRDVTGAAEAIESEDEEEEEQFVQVVLPKPFGGMMEFRKYIKQNTRYDNLDHFEKNLIVRMELSISSSGEITNIRIIKSPGQDFENEAIRLIREGPAWEPGTENGNPADDEVIVKIKFISP